VKKSFGAVFRGVGFDGFALSLLRTWVSLKKGRPGFVCLRRVIYLVERRAGKSEPMPLSKPLARAKYGGSFFSKK